MPRRRSTYGRRRWYDSLSISLTKYVRLDLKHFILCGLHFALLIILFVYILTFGRFCAPKSKCDWISWIWTWEFGSHNIKIISYLLTRRHSRLVSASASYPRHPCSNPADATRLNVFPTLRGIRLNSAKFSFSFRYFRKNSVASFQIFWAKFSSSHLSLMIKFSICSEVFSQF